MHNLSWDEVLKRLSGERKRWVEILEREGDKNMKFILERESSRRK